MDNLAIARILREIADLLEIKDDNPFKIRAYRNGADIVANHPHELARARRHRRCARFPASARTSPRGSARSPRPATAAYHRELLAEFPPTILDLLHLQGVGPKTVATLYRELGIRTLDDLERAARDGRIRALHGHGREEGSADPQGARGAQAHAGRHLLSDAHDAAAALVALPARARAGAPTSTPVGSLRRGCETCGDLDILAVGRRPRR